MFRSRLTLAFVALVVLTLLQGGLALWAARVAAYHVAEGHIANDMLSIYVDLSANKQRLKVWYAQFVLAQDADPALRDQLLASMAESTARLRALAAREELLAESIFVTDIAPTDEAQQLQTVSAIEVNLAALREGILAATPMPANTSRAQIWHEMLQRFDVSQGRDMRVLIAAAIDSQVKAAAAAEAASNRALKTVDRVVTTAMVLAGLFGLALVLYFRDRLRGPIDALVQGARALEGGQLEHRIAIRTSDEFSRVAESFNTMACDLQMHRQREAQERATLEAAVESRTRKLSLANRRLNQIDLRRRQFFAEVSHELRTPLTAIRGEAEIALRGGDRPTADYRDALGRVVSAAGDLASRVTELLQMARAESEPAALDLEATALWPLVVETVAAMQQQAGECGVDLVAVQASDATSNAQAAVDDSRFRQLLTILLDNALRYSGRGDTVSVRVEALPSSATLRILVEDQGIGIESDDLAHLFERNYRGTKARAAQPEGLGLGLVIARALALSHGGQLSLAQREPRGCVACIELPAVDAGGSELEFATSAPAELAQRAASP